MNSSGLSITAVWHDQDAIEVLLEVSSGHFSGAIRAYTSAELLDAAASSLAGFPRAREDSREVLLGAFGPEWAGGAARLHFHCVGAEARPYMKAELEGEEERGGTREAAVVTIHIEAAGLDTFLRELKHLITHRSGSARLRAAA